MWRTEQYQIIKLHKDLHNDSLSFGRVLFIQSYLSSVKIFSRFCDVLSSSWSIYIGPHLVTCQKIDMLLIKAKCVIKKCEVIRKDDVFSLQKMREHISSNEMLRYLIWSFSWWLINKESSEHHILDM